MTGPIDWRAIFAALGKRAPCEKWCRIIEALGTLARIEAHMVSIKHRSDDWCDVYCWLTCETHGLGMTDEEASAALTGDGFRTVIDKALTVAGLRWLPRVRPVPALPEWCAE